ncbi:MAG TPA: HAMP domain-containing sensor histidine kinase, partial [Gemmatimonadales bacterium]|nr:HAMP domain-containing sensor histidine kinase [Gemmatimonadales bacterium]
TMIALLVAVALMLLTTSMRKVTAELLAAVESIRTAEEAEVTLLLLDRASDPLTRGRLTGQLRDLVAAAGDHVTTPEERALQGEASEIVDRMVLLPLTHPELPAEREQAFNALQRLVMVNVAQAHMLQQRTMAWDRLADILAITGGVLILILAVTTIWWLRSRAFKPIFSLAKAMEQFGRGERNTRARVEGPAEIRVMIQRFNDMAAALAAQQDAEAAFIGSVAHDLRTPLGVLLTQFHITSPDRPLPPEPMLRHSLEMVRRQVHRMDRMLQDLVTATTIGSRAKPFRLELGEHDLVEIVRHVAEMFDGFSSRHRVALDLPAEPVVLQIDRMRIEQVLTNLLSNAIKYSPDGGEVKVRLERGPDDVVLSVTDSGVGISPEDQRRLFEPFSRLPSVGRIPGSGLGLYVVRQIVEAHGGSVDVDSAPGAGATFRVILRV